VLGYLLLPKTRHFLLRLKTDSHARKVVT